ncbi:hypothetical protein BD309DRAFT_821032, partial [Dichomitus squalens]
MRGCADGHRELNIPSLSTALSPGPCRQYRRSGKSILSVAETYSSCALTTDPRAKNVHSLRA